MRSMRDAKHGRGIGTCEIAIVLYTKIAGALTIRLASDSPEHLLTTYHVLPLCRRLALRQQRPISQTKD